MKIFLFATVLCLTAMMACTSTTKVNNTTNNADTPDAASLTKFDTQGHRGCRGLMPENTIPAMMHALNLGVTTLEMDVVVTKDKKLVLSHEPFFNHEIATRPDGSLVTEAEEKGLNIFTMNYEEVRSYDVGLRPHTRFPQQQKLKAFKPLLADLFDNVKAYAQTSNKPLPYFNIETKCLPATDNIYHPTPAAFVELLVQEIKKARIENQVFIQSFDFRTLQYLHKNYPGIATVMLIEDTDQISFEAQIKKLGFYANVYSPHYSLVTAALIEKCHQHNMRIIPWTVNDITSIEKLKAMGVDGIISDYPNLYGNEK